MSSAGTCRGCERWNAPSPQAEDAYRRFQLCGGRRVKKPAGSCDQVLLGGRGPYFSATAPEFSCANFTPKPAPARPEGFGQGRGYVTIWKGNRVLWKGNEEDLPARFRDPPAPAPAPAAGDQLVDLRAWLAGVDKIDAAIVFRPSTPGHQRFERHARQLTAAAIRAATDPEALAEVERRLRKARHPDGFSYLPRVWTRAELGVLIVTATNRGRQLRDGPRRPAGPRFDPRRLPDDRLEALIQRHPDLAVVEALREERERRVAGGVRLEVDSTPKPPALKRPTLKTYVLRRDR